MKIAGTYKLVKYGYQYKANSEFKPISEWYSGCIHYCQSGTMNVIVRFSEKPEELSDVVSYSGSYEVVGEEIVHRVTHSVRPEYEGQILTRKFILREGELETEFEDTAEFRKFAVWRKS